MAESAQKDALETDEREGMVREYLDKLLPENWSDHDLGARRTFLYGSDFGTPHEGSVQRETVSTVEIWCECFGRKADELKPADSYAIAALMMRVSGWERTKVKRRIPIYGEQRLYARVVATEKTS